MKNAIEKLITIASSIKDPYAITFSNGVTAKAYSGSSTIWLVQKPVKISHWELSLAGIIDNSVTSEEFSMYEKLWNCHFGIEVKQ